MENLKIVLKTLTKELDDFTSLEQMERDLGEIICRDGRVQHLTLEEMLLALQEMNKKACELCGNEGLSEDFFWRDGEIVTDNQFKVSEYLTHKTMDICCDVCFTKIVDGDIND